MWLIKKKSKFGNDFKWKIVIIQPQQTKKIVSLSILAALTKMINGVNDKDFT